MSLVAGQLVGRYRVDALVGRGGMGEVYRGWDAQLSRVVALKVMREDLDEEGDDESKIEASSRFSREARMAARMVSTHLCAIYEVFEHEGMPVLVMEWIEGASLRTKIPDTSVGITQRLEWIITLARGLADAHASGIIHRDFKPGNVLVTTDGSAIKIVDFGLAKPMRVGPKTLAAETRGFETKTGTILGTERYMAPEQASGAGFDERTDQFAWAIVAYELLSGIHPQNATPRGDFPATPPRSLREATTGVSDQVAKTIARALSFAPSHRFASMRDVVAALDPSSSPRPTARASSAMSSRAATFAMSVGVTFLIAATLGALVFAMMQRKQQRTVTDTAPSASASASAITNEVASVAETPTPPPSISVAESAAPPKPSSSARIIATRSASPSAHTTEKPYAKRLPPGKRRVEAAMSPAQVGPFSMREVRDAIRLAYPAIEACYALPTFDGTDAQLIVDFKNVDDRGIPAKIEVTAYYVRPAVSHYACVEKALTGIALPKPRPGSSPSMSVYINLLE